jgi:hypothetical protein
MAQRVERGAERQRAKIGVRGLMSMKQITMQMRKIIVQAINNHEGPMDAAKAGTLLRSLERLRLAVAGVQYEARLENLERHAGIKANKRSRGRPNGSYAPAPDYDDGEDLDDDRRLQ